MATSDITIVGLQASGGTLQNVLNWAVEDPNISGLPYLRYDHSEVWASTSPTMAGATKIAEAFSAFSHSPITRGQTWYYQIRAVNREGHLGEFCAIESATEVSGDVSLTFPGYWKHPTGLFMLWGTAEVGATLGEAVGTVSLSGPFVIYELHGRVSFDDEASGPNYINLMGFSVTVKGVTISGNTMTATFQIRKFTQVGIESVAASFAHMTRAPTGTVVVWSALAGPSS